MKPAVKLSLFAVLLAGALGGGAAIGAVLGPIDTSDDDADHVIHDGADDSRGTSELPAGGLLVSQDGYTFAPDGRELGRAPFSFTITGPDGKAVTDFAILHDRELHLILARRDLREYAHLHPTRDDDGTWTVEVPGLPAGSYRAFADFQPAGGPQYTLGVDLTVPGPPGPTEPLEAVVTDTVAGFDATLDTDDDGTVTVTIRRDGAVVTTEPYLGAAGHLVAVRDGDLAYLHVHPLDEEPSGAVDFAVEFPSAGVYALFFDFQVDGQVHAARFVVDTASRDASSHGEH